MTEFLNSCVIITPSGQLNNGRVMSEALGFGVETFRAMLRPGSPNGSATHYGLHSYCTDDFVTLVTNAQGGNVDPARNHGLANDAAVISAVNSMTISFEAPGGLVDQAHFQSVIDNHSPQLYWIREDDGT